MSNEMEPTTQAQGTNEAPKKPKSAALTVQSWMENPTMGRALAAALAGYMDAKTFVAQCYIASQSPDLAKCSAESLFKAYLECAQMGLLPGKHHAHVALVPRAGVITVTPEWRGFKFLMERQPGIKRVRPILVHKNDDFEYDAATGVMTHTFDPFDNTRTFEHPDDARAAKRETMLRGGYLKIDHDDGTVEYHFVNAAKIDKNRLCAETQKLWKAWYEEMVLKTVLRDAWSKRVISIDPQLASHVGAAEAADNLALGNDPARATKALNAGSNEDVPNMATLAEGGETASVVPATGSGRAAIGLPVETPAADAS